MKKSTSLPGVIMTVLSVIGVFAWFIMLFFTLFLGGSPGPGYERTVPLIACLFVAFGFVGAIIGTAAGVKALGGNRKAAVTRACISAGFCIVGSIPLFVIELFLMGFVFALLGAFPAGLFLLLVKLSDKKAH